jgi:hypothetical protein
MEAQQQEAPAVFGTWELSLAFWPLQDRPETMKCRATVDRMDLATVFTMKDQCEAQAKKEGKGEAMFGRDAKPAAKSYREAQDDCALLLHPVR